MKYLPALLLISSICFALNTNWSGLNDTSRIENFNDTELHYSKPFALSEFEDLRIYLKVDDGSMVGFANDSIQIEWGYQTFSLCWDSNTVSGNIQRDTCFDSRIALDTLRDDSLGRIDNPPNIGNSNQDGSFTQPLGLVDTLGVTGYAIQTRAFTPWWNSHIRFWVQGLTGNIILSDVTTVFDFKRRLYINVRSK